MEHTQYTSLANAKWNSWIKERGIQIFALKSDINEFIDSGSKEVDLFLEPNKTPTLKPEMKKIEWSAGLGTFIDSRSISSYFNKPLNELTMLEYGCGGGRLLVNFAKYFKFCYGYDISEEAIKLALDVAEYQHVNNIDVFANQKLTNYIKPNSIDFIFSYIVFQHISNRETIEEAFREITNVLNVNGVARLHVRLTNDCYNREDDCFAGWGLPLTQAFQYYVSLCDRLKLKILEFTDDGGSNAGFITFRKDEYAE